MTHHDELDRTLVSFLSDGATRPVRAGLLDAIVADTRTRPQQPGWLVALRGASMGAGLPVRGRTRRLVLIAAVAVLALLAIALVAGRQQKNPLGTGLIAYVHGGDVYLARPDGSEPRVVLHQDGIVFSTVAWSPTGDRLAADGVPGVVVLDVATGSSRLVGGHNPTWSPSGQQLAVVGEWSGVSGLRIADPATGAPNAEYPFAANSGLAWSPNGRWIAASGICTGPLCPSDGGSSGDAVVRIDVATGEVIQIDGRSGHLDSERQVAWSPDSRHLAYTRWGKARINACGDVLLCSTDVVVADADGRNDRIVSRVLGQADQPAWSPDGLWLSFREVDRNTEAYWPASMGIVIERPDGTNVRSLVSQPVEGYAWGPDGDRLWFAVRDTGDAAATVWEASLTGSTRPIGVAIDSGSTPFAGTGFAFGRQVVAPGRSAPPLPPAVQSTPAAILPDMTPPAAAPADASGMWSRLLTQGQDGCELQSLPIGGGSATRIANLCDPQPMALMGSWSPTGSAYATIRDGRLSIVHPDGRVDLDVDHLANLRDVSWSPDGTWLAVGGVPSYVLRPDGTGLHQLPGYQTSWSPDGRTLAISRGDGLLFIGTVDGAAFPLIGTFPAPATWSPDGSRFGFIRDGDLWTAAVDGTDVRKVTSLALGGALWAAWSPDGRWIAVLGSHGLWLVHPDGAGQRWLEMGLGESVSDAIWSPDSSRVAVEITTDMVAVGQLLRVDLVNVDGSTTVRLDAMSSPRWSPDGRFIVATEAIASASSGSEPGSLVLMNADGSGRRSLATAGLDASALVWVR